MNIMIALNEAYLEPYRVMLLSLFYNHPGTEFHVYVVYSEYSKPVQDGLKYFETERISFHFIKTEDSFWHDIYIRERYSKEAYFRLFAADILPKEIERILWLDGDIVINGDITPYYEMDFEDKCYILTADDYLKTQKEIHERLGMPEYVLYGQTGVCLMNLARMRETIDPNAVRDYIKANSESLVYVDQDVLNALYWQEMKILPTNCYNYLVGDVSAREWKRKLRECVVFHYCIVKPWRQGYVLSGFDLYRKYGRMLPDYREKLIKLSRSYAFHSWRYRTVKRLQRNAIGRKVHRILAKVYGMVK